MHPFTNGLTFAVSDQICLDVVDPGNESFLSALEACNPDVMDSEYGNVAHQGAW